MTTDADVYQRLARALDAHRGDAEAYRRLGAQFTARRHMLGPRYGNRRLFVRERLVPLGLKESAAYKLVYDLEQGRLQGRAGFSAGNMLALAQAYEATPDAVIAVLDGGELEPQATSPPLPVPPPRREDVDFSGGDPEGLRPWRQQVLRQLYDALGVLPRLGPGELPEPRDLPGIEEALASMPRDWAPFAAAEKEAAAWNDRALSLHERLTVIAVMRWAIARMDAGERDRRTGLIATAHNYPASAWIPSLVSVGQKALRASP